MVFASVLLSSYPLSTHLSSSSPSSSSQTQIKCRANPSEHLPIFNGARRAPNRHRPRRARGGVGPEPKSLAPGDRRKLAFLLEGGKLASPFGWRCNVRWPLVTCAKPCRPALPRACAGLRAASGRCRRQWGHSGPRPRGGWLSVLTAARGEHNSAQFSAALLMTWKEEGRLRTSARPGMDQNGQRLTRTRTCFRVGCRISAQSTIDATSHSTSIGRPPSSTIGPADGASAWRSLRMPFSVASIFGLATLTRAGAVRCNVVRLRNAHHSPSSPLTALPPQILSHCTNSH